MVSSSKSRQTYYIHTKERKWLCGREARPPVLTVARLTKVLAQLFSLQEKTEIWDLVLTWALNK